VEDCGGIPHKRVLMFRGINAINLDSKGRLAIPARYRDGLGEQVVVTIDTEEACLLLYPVLQWQSIEDSLQRLPSFNTAARRIQRLLIGHATDITLDGNGRTLLPPLLRDYANLDKKVVMIGQGNKFEIWDEVSWQAKRELWLKEEASSDGLPDELQTLFL
jgi:MraZ protein